MTRTSARDLINRVLDSGSAISWDTPPEYGDISDDYRAALERAKERSGLDEAVTIGEGTIGGRPIAYVVSEFSFLGGSIGEATARRIIDGIHQATDRGLPLLISPSSGGTRMQEGTKAFALMISITTAVYRHKDRKLPFLVYLRDPTMGGVMASWGSAGHITFAEPNALLGFLGPRVVEIATGTPMPDGVQVAENLVNAGVIDGVVPVDALAPAVAKLIDVLAPAAPSAPLEVDEDLIITEPTEQMREKSAWEAITLTRDPSRPTLANLMEHLPANTVLLHGSGDGRKSDAVKVAITQLGGMPIMLIGQNRASEEPLGTNALRMARRGISLAKSFNLPLVSIIDTDGAELSQYAEEHGLAGSIGRTLGELVDADVPTVSVILGQGCGGGALAMLPSDVVLCAENGWLSPLPPEGASAILYRDADHAPEMMETDGVKATDLMDSGLIDGIIPELPNAADEPDEFIERVLTAIHASLEELHTTPQRVGREQRFVHYEKLAQLQQ